MPTVFTAEAKIRDPDSIPITITQHVSKMILSDESVIKLDHEEDILCLEKR